MKITTSQFSNPLVCISPVLMATKPNPINLGIGKNTGDKQCTV